MSHMSKTEEKLYKVDESKIICFDLETTGLNDRDEILQIAIINGYGDVLFNEYIKPKRKKKWPKAEEINHISPSDVQNCQTFSYYRDVIQEIFDDAEYVIGYNCNDFDIPIIERAGIDVKGKKYDVYEAAKKYLKKKKGAEKFKKMSLKLECVAPFDFGYNFNAHDALEDCRATLHVFNCIVSDDSFGRPSSDDEGRTAWMQEEDEYVYSESYDAPQKPKKTKKTMKTILLGLIMMAVGLLGVIISAKILSGGIGPEYVLKLSNFSNYVFDAFAALTLIGLLIVILVVRKMIKSR